MNLLDTFNQFKRIKRTGLVDTLKGKREPDPSVAKVPAAELRTRLLAVKGTGYPLEVVEGEGGAKGDLVARWRIRDAQWWNHFKRADTNAVVELLLVLDEGEHEVRVKEKSITVRWNGNVPKVGGFSTKPAKVDTNPGVQEPVVEADDPLNPDRRRWYVLDSNELRELVGELVNRAGWSYKQVWRKKTLTGS